MYKCVINPNPPPNKWHVTNRQSSKCRKGLQSITNCRTETSPNDNPSENNIVPKNKYLVTGGNELVKFWNATSKLGGSLRLLIFCRATLLINASNLL